MDPVAKNIEQMPARKWIPTEFSRNVCEGRQVNFVCLLF
jgi:hypothetical protein